MATWDVTQITPSGPSISLGDLIARIQRQLPEDVPRRVAYDVRFLRDQVRSRYQTLLDAHPWGFQLVWATGSLPAAYSEGTVTVTKGSTTVTGTNTSWAQSHVGYKFLAQSEVPITVSAVSGPTSLTLSVPWAKESASGISYALVPLDTSLPDGVSSVIAVWTSTRRLKERTVTYLDSVDPSRTSSGTPICWSTRGAGKIEIWPYPRGGAVVRILAIKSPQMPSLMTDKIYFPNLSILEVGVRASVFAAAFAESGDEKFMATSAALETQFTRLLDELKESDRTASSWISSVEEVEYGEDPRLLDPILHDTLPF